MKKSKIIAPALGVLILSTAASISGTVAWFTANNSVAVTGMSVTTKVGSNLLICATNTSDDDYETSLSQTRSGTLMPVSTVNGTAFFYTSSSNVNGSGDAKTDSYVAYSEAAVNEPSNALANLDAGKTNYDAAFNTAYGVTDAITTSNVVYGYIDYSFYLKATNAANAAKELRLTTCNLLYDGAAVTETAWRVAMFATTAAKETPVNNEVDNNNRKTILALSGATNFTPGEAVSSTSATATVTYGTGAVVASVGAGSTQRYKVTVRLWLEGEDSTCTNDTFANLTASYTLGLAFEINEEHPAVTVIGSVAA